MNILDDLKEPAKWVCLTCMKRILGKQVDSLTWAHKDCCVCGKNEDVATKVKFVQQLKGKV